MTRRPALIAVLAVLLLAIGGGAAAFSIRAPNIGGFVAVEDHGTLEFLVNLTKS